ncbi:MAG: SDR family NAD(P)-dependent oxidoreductase, partial [Gammaproteobacteria bacterium]|nr:SDR family NAD(P)-dependent oxidoreductase [Gammaproteobacteria bacterium]
MTSTFLVTGATDGIGRATALALARQGACVIIHGRNPGKLEATLGQLRAANPNADVHAVLADFASLAEVASLAGQLRGEFPGLSVLINNAGLLTDYRQTSVDGFELTFPADDPPARHAQAQCTGAHRECRLDGHGGRDSGFLEPAARSSLRRLAGLRQQQTDERAVESPSGSTNRRQRRGEQCAVPRTHRHEFLPHQHAVRRP